MTPRDTTTRGVLEAMVLPALKRGGCTYQVQQRIGQRFGGGVHVVDAIAEKDQDRYLISNVEVVMGIPTAC